MHQKPAWYKPTHFRYSLANLASDIVVLYIGNPTPIGSNQHQGLNNFILGISATYSGTIPNSYLCFLLETLFDTVPNRIQPNFLANINLFTAFAQAVVTPYFQLFGCPALMSFTVLRSIPTLRSFGYLGFHKGVLRHPGLARLAPTSRDNLKQAASILTDLAAKPMNHIDPRRMALLVSFQLRRCHPKTLRFVACLRRQLTSTTSRHDLQEPRLSELGRTIRDDYATLRSKYQTPDSPIVLAHGLMGFDELRLVGKLLPGVHYWRGITEALTANGNEVILTSVPPSASIEERAAKLSDDIEKKAGGKSVNIIAHSMGGLDARYMISQLKPPNVHVRSLTTIASPHRGSAFADYLFERIGEERLPKIYSVLRAMSIETGAFSQLTRRYMVDEFNPKTPDREGVAYFSYGAMATPPLWSAFRQSHRIVEEVEGANDGLVSVASSQWGNYKGTLEGVSHLDLINWTNRLRWLVWEMVGNKRNFNAIAFYLDIADMLAKEGY